MRVSGKFAGLSGDQFCFKSGLSGVFSTREALTASIGNMPMAAHDLTAARLRELLHYDPATGLFTRLISLSPNARMTPTPGYAVYNPRICNRKHSLSVDGRQYLAHRLAWLYMTGAWPEAEVDHIDGDGRNNRWSNLRAVTRAENVRNLPRPKSNTSGSVGVNWRESKQRWRAFIAMNGKTTHLGYFRDKESAIAARRAAEVELGYHENHGRQSPWPRLQ